MDKLRVLYQDAEHFKEKSLLLLLDFLVKEKKVLSLDDDESKLNHYLQERYKNKMNEHLKEYKHETKRG